MSASQRGFQNELIISLIGCVLLVIAAACLILWIQKRKFYRRNVAGLEEFPHFRGVVVISLLERIGLIVGRLVLVCSVLFGLGLAVFIYIGNHLPTLQPTTQASIVETQRRDCAEKAGSGAATVGACSKRRRATAAPRAAPTP